MSTSTGSVTDTVRAPAGFIGSLADTPLAEVLRRIVREERSGDLQVTTPDVIKTIYFDRGFIVFASSNRKDDRLGESLIEAGRISRQEFAAASMLMKKTRQKFGRVLVQSGIVSEEELGHLVAAQVNRIVLSLFSAKRGMYSFDERPTVIPIELMVSLSVYRILMEGIRRMTSKKLVLAGLPALSTEVRVVDRPPFTFDLQKLIRVEREVAKLATEGASLSRIVELIGGNDGVSLRACYGLVSAGILGFTSSATTPRRRLRVQEETGTFVLSEIRRKVGVPEEPPPPPPLESPRPRKAPVPVLDEQLEPLSPPASPSPGPWRRLWSALIVWWRGSPERPIPTRVSTTPAHPAPSPAVPEAPLRQPGPVEERRSTAAEARVPVATAVAEAASSSEREPSSGDVARSPDSTAPEWKAPDWSVAEDASAQFQDFYEELGIESSERTAPGEVCSDADRIVESEQHVASMLRHIPVEAVTPVEERVEVEIAWDLDEEVERIDPPVRPPGLGETGPSDTGTESKSDVDGDLVEVALEVEVEAETETSEDRQGAEHEQAMLRMKAGGGEQRLLRDVKLHFRLRDWEGAVPLLEQLVSISPGSALYRGMLARALSRHPVRRKEAEEHFVEALRMAPQDSEIHYWLGLYYKSFGLDSRAATEFRTTLRIDPEHQGARAQLGVGKKEDALGAVIKKIFG